MRQYINGQEYEIPVDHKGRINSEEVRRAAGIPTNRALILQKPDGRNLIVNPGQDIKILPGEHLRDSPIHKRG